MPTSDDLDGFILKKEACATYDRSFRQLGRDLDRAFTKRDEPFLDNFRLRIEDGSVLCALEIDKEKIQKLRDKGLNPTWFVRERWMNDAYGRRKDGEAEKTARRPADPAVPNRKGTQETDTGTADITQTIVSIKDDFIAFLREENTFLRETLSKERERSSEDRQLTRELHVLLKNMQDRLLPAPDPAKTVVTVNAPTKSPTEPRANAAVSARSAASKKPSMRNDVITRVAKQSASRNKKRNAEKSKWYQTPTLKRFLSSKR